MVHGGEWAEISAYSRILVSLHDAAGDQSTDAAQIFSGCLHRSLDRLDMQDRLSSFIFGSYKPGWLGTSPTQASISVLADAVIEINGLFVESKTYLRSYMLSAHAHESLPGDICHARKPFPAVEIIANVFRHSTILPVQWGTHSKHFSPRTAPPRISLQRFEVIWLIKRTVYVRCCLWPDTR